MPIKHQSFDVSQRRKSSNHNRSDKNYDAKISPYFKYFLIPAVFGFLLLCILLYVDFFNVNQKSLEKTHAKEEMENVMNTRHRDDITESLKSESLNSKEIFNTILNVKYGNIESKFDLPRVLKDKKNRIASTPSRDAMANVLNEKFSSVPRKHFVKNYANSKVNNRLSSDLVKDTLSLKMNDNRSKEESTFISLIHRTNPTTSKINKFRSIKFKATKVASSLSNNAMEFQRSITISSTAQKFFNNSMSTKIILITRKAQEFNINKLSPNQTIQGNQTKSLVENRKNKLFFSQIGSPIRIHRQLGKTNRRFKREDFAWYSNPTMCVPYLEYCTLKCANGDLRRLVILLEEVQLSCRNQSITLELINCIFIDGIMKNNTLSGSFALQELQIINCSLTTIQEGAFKGTEFKNLHTLKIINNTIVNLTSSTFNGLTQLKYFEFYQHVIGEKEIGKSFLTPFAATLTSLKIMLLLENNAAVDPNAWLTNANFLKLYTVDLSHNNLKDKLNGETFQNLPAVGNLSLVDCSLQTTDLKTFQPLLKTLQYLYLDNNNLITLNGNFLDALEYSEVILSAKNNNWQCICDHSDMWDYMYYEWENKYINKQDFNCSGPPELKGQYMEDLYQRCYETKTTSTTTTTSTTAKSTTATSTTAKEAEITDTIEQTITAGNPMLTTSTTEEPANTNDFEQIKCAAKNSSENLTISLQPRTSYLTFIPTATNSIKIISSVDSRGFSIIQFLTYPQFSVIHPTSSHEWPVQNLNANYNYIFCLVHGNATTISPFDCWGYSRSTTSVVDAWLLTSDKAWFVGATLIVALFFFVLGTAAVNLTLRSRPSLLVTFRRLPSICRIRNSSTSDNPQLQVPSATYLIPQPMNESYSKVGSSHYISRHKLPIEDAPTLPDAVKAHSANISNNLLQRNDFILSKPIADRQRRWTFCTEGSDYGYNTINVYEEIKY